MIKIVRDNANNLIAVVEMDEVALTTRMINNDVEFSAIVMKSGHVQFYATPFELLVQQLYEI